ncbi:MAG: hypothetical protein IJT59_03570 [Desulfovibrionaceae bacterium]|nr:hypothetical protein [Desulfovibrionaceae bacterium]
MADTQTKSAEIPEEMKDFLQRLASLSGLTIEEVSSLYEQAKKGATLAEMFNIPPESLAAGYTLAYNLFNAGQYNDAETMFRALCQYDNTNPKHWLGLGCTLQKLGLFREASFCFAHAADLGHPPKIKALFLLAQCCATIEDYPTARQVLELAFAADPGSDSVELEYLNFAKDLMAKLPKD